jgi:putative PIN family toxin of toxin-antitoxin system
MKVILDANVLVAGLKSRLGASFTLIALIKTGQVQPAVTTPLLVEYEAVLTRPGLLPADLDQDDITGFLDWFVSLSSRHRVHYLWRPYLPDPQDDLVLEAAMAAGARYLITFNLRHFRDLATLGIVVLTPAQFLKHLQP